MRLAWIVAAGLVASAGGVAAAGAFLLLPAPTRARALPGLLGYASGSLLGAALLGLVPEAMAHLPPPRVLAIVLGGVVAFFGLESWLVWRHCHEPGCEVHGTSATLVLVGDALHNAVDGIAIGAAFVVSVPLGIATTAATLVHEVPQEVGDLAILLDAGYSRRRAFALNLASSATTLVGAILGFLALELAATLVPWILALSAAGFLYIAMADLMPGLHRRSPVRPVVRLVPLLAGIATIAILRSVVGG